MDEYGGLNSNQLMGFVRNSSKRAFERLYDRHWEKHFVHAFAILGDKSLAKDVVQDVWVSIWERRESIDGTNIEAYLLRAVKLRAYKEIRNTAYRQNLTKDLIQYSFNAKTSNNVSDDADFKDTHNIISIAVNELPSRCKEVFELSRNEGLKNNEIAEKLNISQRTVETHISNALRFLKTKVAFEIASLLSLVYFF